MAMKLDGNNFKDGYKTIANIRNDQIREGTGSTVLANVRNDQIREKSGSTVIANTRNGDVRKGSGSSKLTSFAGFDGGKMSWALWYLFCK